MSAQDNAAHIKGEVLVMLHKTGQLKKLLTNNTELHLKQVISKRSGIYLLSFDSLQNEQMILNKLRTNSEIEIAQFNHITQSRALPDDLSFGTQYALHNTGQSGGTIDADIDAPEAWDITTGGLTSAGDSIVIAIVDDGFQLTHPDLNFWKNNFGIAANGIDDDGNGFIDDTKGWNAANNSNNIVLAQHGTHVTGIAAAKGNNAMGVSGVDWKSKVMPVIGSTTLESVAVAAYTYVLECRRLYNETNGAKGAFVVVTNSSFGVNQGQPANFPIWCAMYDSLGKQGI
ncbi:MAG: S8 family serine peptidase, partial [Bacteroidia bacterium]